MPILKVQGTSVHYRETGSGAPVVFLHGGGSSGAQWRGVVDLLAERYRLITMDHYGHGGTSQWTGAADAHSHDAEALLVRAVIDHVGDPVHLVGHSYGGGVALRMAVNFDAGLRSLVLLEPLALSVLSGSEEQVEAVKYRDSIFSFLRHIDSGAAEAAWAQFLDSNAGPGTWERLPLEARVKYIERTPIMVPVSHAVLNHRTTPAQCQALRQRTLLLCGDRTNSHFRAMTCRIAEMIPSARFEWLPGAGHMAPLTHPENIANELLQHWAQA